MSRNYKISDQDKRYFISFATVNWIDAMTRPNYKDIIVDSLRFCVKQKGLEVYAWCIMSNHVHLIIGSTQMKIEDIVRDLKRHTSKAILSEVESNPTESRKEWMLWMFEKAGKRNSNNSYYQFWQQNNQPILLDSNVLMDQKLNYLHFNPVMEGLVFEPDHYPYSSAIDYGGGKGKVPIVFLD